MDRHPGGVDHTLRMLDLAQLPRGGRVLDMGAGDGSAVRLLRSLGYDARGIDLAPRGEDVEEGDYLAQPYGDGTFDGILSQCSFHVSGDGPRAMGQAARMLKAKGKLLFSDVHFREQDPGLWAEAAGLRVLHREDMTEAWKQYYIEALWRGDAPCLSRGQKYSYTMLICERM